MFLCTGKKEYNDMTRSKLDVLSLDVTTIYIRAAAYCIISHNWLVESQSPETVTMFTKALVVVCCLVAAVLAEEKYTDKYDNINIPEILENKKLLEAYVNCMLDKGKCTAEGKELKNNIQDALETGCSKCTEAQQKGVTTVMDHLISSEREYWNQLCAKYDPEGVWRKKYEQEAKERGITIPKE